MENDQASVDLPRIKIGASILLNGSGLVHICRTLRTHISNMGPHSLEERLNVVDRAWSDKLTVIEPQADPQVIHENWEANHHSCNTPWSTKFPATRSQNFAKKNGKKPAHEPCWSNKASNFLPSSVVVFSGLSFPDLRWRSSPLPLVSTDIACKVGLGGRETCRGRGSCHFSGFNYFF